MTALAAAGDRSIRKLSWQRAPTQAGVIDVHQTLSRTSMRRCKYPVKAWIFFSPGAECRRAERSPNDASSGRRRARADWLICPTLRAGRIDSGPFETASRIVPQQRSRQLKLARMTLVHETSADRAGPALRYL